MASTYASRSTISGHSSNPSWDSVSTPPVRNDSPAWEVENLEPPTDPRAKLQETRPRESQRERNGRPGLRPKPRFRDLTFKRTFSAFDRKNEAAANSPFYGFFTLSWLAVALFILKTAVGNWKLHGNPLGTNDIMKIMISRDVFVLLASDGAMCALAVVPWLLQKIILYGYVDWDTTGWLWQSIWEVVFIYGFVGLTIARDWPWTHTVFFVLHGLVLLMKQHSYAFYNGHLSTLYKDRILLVSALKKLHERSDGTDTSTGHSTSVSAAKSVRYSRRGSLWTRQHLSRTPSREESEADEPEIDQVISEIDSDAPIAEEDVPLYDMVLEGEIDFHTKELVRNTTAKERAYPNNLNLFNLAEYLLLPTVVYELEYPRTESINWYYVLEKVAATVGILVVMNLLSQTFIYPVVIRAVSLKEMGVPLSQRLQEFPWMLSDLIFPFMGEYLLTWFLIWETILNALAEVTRFADRSFYGPWWNSVSWDQYARDWNRPVHSFLLRHVYHSSISTLKVKKHTATLITFLLSAVLHELIMWCLFKKLRGYLLMLQMFQLPMVRLSRTAWLRDRKILGNIFFWLGLFTGPSVLCSLYLIL